MRWISSRRILQTHGHWPGLTSRVGGLQASYLHASTAQSAAVTSRLVNAQADALRASESDTASHKADKREIQHPPPNNPSKPAIAGFCISGVGWLMRISSDPDDSHFHPHFAHCRIYLAGAERSNVITADEGGRFAVTYRLDEFGITVRDKKTGQALTDRFYGDVRIACSDWLRQAMEAPQDDDSGALGAAIYGMITPP